MSILSLQLSDFPDLPQKYGAWSLASATSTDTASATGSLYLVYSRPLDLEKVDECDRPYLDASDTKDREIRIGDHPSTGGDGENCWYVGPHNQMAETKLEVYAIVEELLDRESI